MKEWKVEVVETEGFFSESLDHPLAVHLNALESDGWTIFSITSIGHAYRFYVIASRALVK